MSLTEPGTRYRPSCSTPLEFKKLCSRQSSLWQSCRSVAYSMQRYGSAGSQNSVLSFALWRRDCSRVFRTCCTSGRLMTCNLYASGVGSFSTSPVPRVNLTIRPLPKPLAALDEDVMKLVNRLGPPELREVLSELALLLCEARSAERFLLVDDSISSRKLRSGESGAV